MEYSITYDTADVVLVVTINGLLDLGAMSKMLNELANQIIETQCARILVDLLNAEVKLSLIDLITLSGMIQSAAREQDVNLAPMRRVIVSQMNGRMMELYEVIARYIGGPFARFNNLEDARAWLKQTGPNEVVEV